MTLKHLATSGLQWACCEYLFTVGIVGSTDPTDLRLLNLGVPGIWPLAILTQKTKVKPIAGIIQFHKFFKYCRDKSTVNVYSALLWRISSLKRSDVARVNKWITQFYLPPTHEPYLPLLPSHTASLPFDWYSLCLPTEGWPDTSPYVKLLDLQFNMLILGAADDFWKFQNFLHLQAFRFDSVMFQKYSRASLCPLCLAWKLSMLASDVPELLWGVNNTKVEKNWVKDVSVHQKV